MNKRHFAITSILFLFFLYLRLQVRFINPLWADEIEEIRGLASFQFLMHYLPSITAGYPGQYLLILPIYLVFGANKFILGVPGLLSQSIVFLLIPLVITKLNIVAPKYIFFTSTIARFLLLLDPKLTFQAMEIRPYSLMPLLWCILVLLISYLISFDRMKELSKLLKFKIFLVFSLLLLLFNWHAVSAIMTFSIYLYFIFPKNKGFISNIFKRRSLYIILGTSLISIPIWSYFAAENAVNHFSTVATLFTSIQELYALDKGGLKGIYMQNLLYLFALFIMLVILISQIYRLIKMFNRIKLNKESFYLINIFLVLLPLIFIFLTDLEYRYGFWLRQFAWIMIPFYMSIGVVISQLKYRKIILKMRKLSS